MTPAHALPKGRFLADPAWSFRTRSAKGRNRCPDGQGHYKVMSLADIKALPVGALTAPDCALFLWVVDCKIPEGLAVGSAWGFTRRFHLGGNHQGPWQRGSAV